jgi:hypothetical protein
MDDLESRIAALETREQIRQLAASCALALDSRDVPTLASLFVEDATPTPTRGSAWRRWSRSTSRTSRCTTADVDGPRCASTSSAGSAYNQAILYTGAYRRVAGRW